MPAQAGIQGPQNLLAEARAWSPLWRGRADPSHSALPIFLVTCTRAILRQKAAAMVLLDTISLTILLGAVLVLAGILSSLLALRFGAPLLLVFLLIGMLAGEAGPGGLPFSDVRTTYTVGSIALALILFDGG